MSFFFSFSFWVKFSIPLFPLPFSAPPPPPLFFIICSNPPPPPSFTNLFPLFSNFINSIHFFPPISFPLHPLTLQDIPSPSPGVSSPGHNFGGSGPGPIGLGGGGWCLPRRGNGEGEGGKGKSGNKISQGADWEGRGGMGGEWGMGRMGGECKFPFPASFFLVLHPPSR